MNTNMQQQYFKIPLDVYLKNKNINLLYLNLYLQNPLKYIYHNILIQFAIKKIASKPLILPKIFINI